MNILFPIDGSDGSQETMTWAVDFLNPDETMVYLLNVIPSRDGKDVGNDNLYQSKSLLMEARHFFEEYGFSVQDNRLVAKSAVDGICRFADHHPVDEIIMGSQGNRPWIARKLFGSVTEEVYKCASQTVLIVRNQGERRSLKLSHSDELRLTQREDHPLNILIPVDGSRGAFNTLQWASDFLAHQRCRIHLLHVIEYHPSLPPSVQDFEEATHILEQSRRFLELRHCKVHDTQYLVDDPATGICSYANQKGIDEIIMGSHGHRTIRQQLIGSVSRTVFETARQPVLLLRNDNLNTLEVSQADQVHITQSRPSV